jgi:histone-lysine N-methyltransferase SETD2
MDKFRNKLSKEDLKKFAKEIGKKLVASDFKHNRVEDPTKIDPKVEKKVKKYVKEFFDKAVAKKAAHDKLKAGKKSSQEKKDDVIGSGDTSQELAVDTPTKIDEDIDMSDVDDIPASPGSPPESPSSEGLKRKRDELGEGDDATPTESPHKRIKEDGSPDVDVLPSPPPPPPPPPAEDLEKVMDEEDAELRAQEEALMRENEEALRDAEMHEEAIDAPIKGSIDDVDAKVNGLTDEDMKVKAEDHDKMGVDRDSKDVELKLEMADEANSLDEKKDVNGLVADRKEVLSH